MRELFAIGSLLVVGCVFPSDAPTGIEFSWTFREVEASDGADAKRIVTCAATGVETIAASLEDLEHVTRRGTFRFPCEDGFQTASDVARGQSEAFLELRPHEYDVDLRSEHPGVPSEQLESRTIDVNARSVTLELWEFKLAPIDWTVELTNATMCTDFSLGMYYADPESALGDDVPVDDDGKPEDVLYRKKLVSDRGLGVAAQSGGCAEQDGAHHFVGLDRGTYRLDVVVDDEHCAIELDLNANTTTTIDLAALPC